MDFVGDGVDESARDDLTHAPLPSHPLPTSHSGVLEPGFCVLCAELECAAALPHARAAVQDVFCPVLAAGTLHLAALMSEWRDGGVGAFALQSKRRCCNILLLRAIRPRSSLASDKSQAFPLLGVV